MGRPEPVVVVVHLPGQLEQRLAAGGAGRAGADELVAKGCPRHVGHDVHGDRDDPEADRRPDDRQAEHRPRPQPAVRRRRRRFGEPDRIVGLRDRGERTEAPHPGEPQEQPDDPRAEDEEERELDGIDRHGGKLEGGGRPAKRDRREEHEDAEDGRRDDGEPGLLGRPGDRMEDGHEDRPERQGDHHRHEDVVRPARRPAGRHDHRHVAEDRRPEDQAEDQRDPPERRPAEDEDRDPGDRIQGDPLRGEAQAEQDPDQRERDPERPWTAPAARPERREQGVGGDDEQPDVDIVHPDPALDEEHPVDEDEDARR